jgi:ADP-heptose:LPS heptosyltransferase
MLKFIKRKSYLSIKDHYLRRNKVLIKRIVGGFGDIVMQRMMIEDFAKTGLEVHYACPLAYMEMMKNHPYLKELKEISKTREEEYGIVYDISTICAIIESTAKSKNQKHRSDIWANYCGVTLEKHETYLKSDIDELNFYKKELEKLNPENKKIIFLSTKSVDSEFGKAKSLDSNQVKEVVEKLKNLNYFLVTADNEFQEIYSELGIKQFVKMNPKSWIALIDACDFVISIDTAAFHIAGALKKPLVGIFAFVDGKVYGKYYDFILVQRHRDNGNWPCGPCYAYTSCSKDKTNNRKPCIEEITSDEIIKAFKKLKNLNSTNQETKIKA